MRTIRFFTDEDVHRFVAPQLRRDGYDALSTPEADRLGETDESQLEFAHATGRCLVTFNVSDFARLHHEWAAAGRQHSGIVVSAQRPIGDMLRRLSHLGQSVGAAEMQNRLEYLSHW